MQLTVERTGGGMTGTPMCRRISMGVTFLATLWSGVAAAQALTEAEVIRLATARDPRALTAREAAGVAKAEEVRAGVYPNPSVGWEREHVPGLTGERTDDFVLTVPVEVDGRRWANRALARAGVARAEATAAQAQSEAVTLALHGFYAALAGAKSVEIARRSVSRLDEAARVISRRQEAGTTSGYERARLEVEAELARSILRQAEGRARLARTALALRLGLEPGELELTGDFTTAAPPQTLAGLAPTRPSVRLLQTAEHATRDARAAASWSWLPTLSLTGGLRIEETLEERLGYVAGVFVALPVLATGQDIRAEASARQQLARAEVRAAEQNAQLEVVQANQLLVAAAEELQRFEEAIGERVALLERAAESGYREGERSIVELLDAQRARTEVERRRLELQLAAKRAEIDLRAARGEFE